MGGTMANPILYRKRLIPEECILLKDDIVQYCSPKMIVTTWHSLKPRKDLHHGCSCYYLSEGFKISRFYREDNTLIFWYCDIVDYEYREDTDTYTITDLLADVIVCPDGFVKVVDIDELVTARRAGILSDELLEKSLLRLDRLLREIYAGNFHVLQKPTENYF